MTEVERGELIASLTGHQGYVLLLKDLGDIIDTLVEGIVSSERDDQIVKSARILQVFYKYLNLLSTEPDRIRQHLDEDLKMIKESSPTPFFPPHRQALLERIENGDLQ